MATLVCHFIVAYKNRRVGRDTYPGVGKHFTRYVESGVLQIRSMFPGGDQPERPGTKTRANDLNLKLQAVAKIERFGRHPLERELSVKNRVGQQEKRLYLGRFKNEKLLSGRKINLFDTL